MTDDRIIAYLLEELSETEAEQFEDDCFAEESWPVQIEHAEEDLIDSYLRGGLDKDRRERFEKKYLQARAREERVLIAAALLRHVDEHHASAPKPVPVTPKRETWIERLREFQRGQRWALRALAALIVIALIAGVSWIWRRGATEPKALVSLNLTIDSKDTRGPGVPISRVKLPPPGAALKLILTLPAERPTAAGYKVQLESHENDKLSFTVSEQTPQTVSIVIPAEELRRSEYRIRLVALEDDGTEERIPGRYFFNVE